MKTRIAQVAVGSIVFTLSAMAFGQASTQPGQQPPTQQGGGQTPPAPGGGDQGNGQAFANQVIDRLMAGDANHDGKLSKSELPAESADRLFSMADADKDGFLTREELSTFFVQRLREGGPGGPGGQGGPGGGPGARGIAAERNGGEQISFGGYMRQANRPLRGLQRSAFDADSRDSDLQQIGMLESALIGAKSRIATLPMAPQAKEHYGTDESAYRRDVRKALLAAINAALELEAAVTDGRGDDARTCMKKLVDVQSAGHKAFNEEMADQPPAREP